MKNDTDTVTMKKKTKPRSFSSRLLNKLGLQPLKTNRQTLLEQLRAASKNEDVLNHNALVIVEGAIICADMQAHEMMVPRSQIECININDASQHILRTVVESGHSRFPVFDEDNKEVLGILLAKDLIALMLENSNDLTNLRNIIRPVAKIQEHKRLLILLNEFQEQRNHMAIVYDEYGDIAGLITIEDILEVIVGDIEDEHDEEAANDIRIIDESNFIVKAITPIETFNEYFSTDFNDSEVDTIGGLIMQTYKRIPKRDDIVKLGALNFKVMQADKKRIYLLRLTK